MDLETGLLAVVTLSSGIYITVHELRRKERKTTRKEINELTGQVNELLTETEVLRKLLLEQRSHIYKLTILMIDSGLNPPQPPAPSFDPGEYPVQKDPKRGL